MNIILLGAPGAGKGTLASQMNERYNIPHISTGEIFRENIKNNTELGKLAKSYIDSGSLVPDDVTTKMMVDRLEQSDCNNGYILDGFPRTIAQAEGLINALNEKNKKTDLVILVDAEDSKIIERLIGRRVCEKCGATYHTEYFPPKVSDVCDICSSKLIQRKDDTDEVVKNRLATYHEQTKPLIEFYDKFGILKKVDGFAKDIEGRLKLIDEMLKW